MKTIKEIPSEKKQALVILTGIITAVLLIGYSIFTKTDNGRYEMNHTYSAILGIFMFVTAGFFLVCKIIRGK